MESFVVFVSSSIHRKNTDELTSKHSNLILIWIENVLFELSSRIQQSAPITFGQEMLSEI